jgi:hypothetical protein
VDDAAAMRLVLDNLQVQQAKRELQTAEEVLPRAARECYKWLLCPMQTSPTDQKPTVEAFPLNTSGSGLGSEIERVCSDNELVISTWSPIHLRTKLQELYWKSDKLAIEAIAFWEDTLRFLYLPRLKNRDVLAQAIVKGASSRDFFGTAYGQHEGEYDGFKLGDPNVQLDDTLLLIAPDAANRYQTSLLEVLASKSNNINGSNQSSKEMSTEKEAAPRDGACVVREVSQMTKVFYGCAEVNPATAKMRMVQLADEITSILASDPQAELKITVEINANFPHGVSDQIKRAVSENAKSLALKIANWE